MAEALAQTSIHTAFGSRCLLDLEKLSKRRAATNAQISIDRPQQSICDLFMSIHTNSEIRNADSFQGGTFEKNGNFWEVLPTDLMNIAASFKIQPLSSNALDRGVAEMINVSAWLAAAPQRVGKEAKIDFFFMHCVNCSIFLSVFAKADWMSLETKARLLEFKVRTDLIIFANQGSPELRTEAINDYEPRRSDCNNWSSVFDRALKVPDDGHVVKMIRALRHGSIISRPYEEAEEASAAFPVKGDMWVKIANMVLDTTEDHPHTLDKWMRGPGFDQAWDIVPDRVTVESQQRKSAR